MYRIRVGEEKQGGFAAWFHMLRRATSAVLRCGAELSAAVLFILPGTKAKPQPFCASRVIRPFSLTACLSKTKKKTSLWSEHREGQNMDGNMEEILAPLRQAVKEQVRKMNRSPI